MERRRVEERVRDWLWEAATDPKTGAPPVAKATVEATGPRVYGSLINGEPDPQSSMRWWSVTVTLHFPAEQGRNEPLDQRLDVAPVIERLAQSIQLQPWLGGGRTLLARHGFEVRPASARPRRLPPQDYPEGIELHMSVQEGERPDS